MTRLIFIRHGQSVANEQNRFAGHTDVPLTELGKAQAERAAEYIVKHEKIDKIYSSDLRRAHDTALPVSKLTNIPITDTRELREICAGVWEGRLVSEIATEYEKEFYTWRNDFSNARLPEGESVESPIRAVDCNSRGWGWQRMSDVPFVNNSAISIFEYDPETDTLSLIERDITDHLDQSLMSYIPKGLRN